MSKLFDEVLHGGYSADILIHLSGHCTGICEAAVASPRSGACRSARSGSSPTTRPQTLSPGTESAVRCAHETPASPLRCHTLVLATQPSLLQMLLPDHRKSQQALIVAISTPPIDVEGSTDAPGSEEGNTFCDCHSSGTPVRTASPDVHDPHCASPRSPIPAAAHALDAGYPRSGVPLADNTDAIAVRNNAGLWEVTVDDDADTFLELIRFVYLNTCQVDESNVKALMHVADKYGIEDVVIHCLHWMEDNFTASLFFHFLTFNLSNERFSRLLTHRLLESLRSRRNFTLVTDDTDSHWERLPVSFVEALLNSDELPVTSETEVLRLLARWASGVVSREAQRELKGPPKTTYESCCSSGASDDEINPVKPAAAAQSPSPSAATAPPAEVALTGAGGHFGPARSRLGASADEAAENTDSNVNSADLTASPDSDRARDDMLRLLRTFRSCDMVVKIRDLVPILQVLQVNELFSTKTPRETALLDPRFMIYRGVAGVPATLDQSNLVEEPWKGGNVSFSSRDFMQQQDGFQPRSVPGGGIVSFPRLCVRIKCSSWSHLQKRSSKAPSVGTGLVRHSVSWPMSGDVSPSPEALIPNLPVVAEAPVPPTLKTMQSQDDWEIGRKMAPRTGTNVPNLTDNEKIDHKVVCAVISGHMRHGIRIGQRERNSIYDIEELHGQYEDACIGGTPTEVEFELQLTVQAPNPCGICRVVLAVLPIGSAEPLMEIVFDASAEEHLHFYVASNHFDSNSTYSVALNWVLPRSTVG